MTYLALNEDVMVRKSYSVLLGNTHIFYYPLIFSQNIKVLGGGTIQMISKI